MYFSGLPCFDTCTVIYCQQTKCGWIITSLQGLTHLTDQITVQMTPIIFTDLHIVPMFPWGWSTGCEGFVPFSAAAVY